MSEPLRYRALEKVYVDGVLYSTDDEFISDKPPGDAWEPLDKAGVKAKSTHQAARKAIQDAREFALRHPEAHIGEAAPGNSAMTPEQAAEARAILDLGLTPEEIATIQAARIKK